MQQLGGRLRSAWLEAEEEREMSSSQQRQPINRALTLRERQVAALVSGGLSNKQVARRLEMSEGTVKIHLHNIYGKLGVRAGSAKSRP
jgi:two-component system, NarL family, nitrate/nitrite response regulator NarL